ncbi:4-hydroxybenzoyl-CoA thioesterase [Porphyromonadaceae bacterium COT-184 OH4590]|nr:4-hydroxybenzoyl-CoA thioesterase [Porphyromonadaceae bacterium COT-184 OH4590]MDO4726122.1 acyl-CoA thioesterase [Porphyromonadaceae bacterium]
MKVLKSQKEFEIRFSEVDSMGIVWHGSYSLYFEDAREQFGKEYNLGYLYIFEQGFYAPLVELHLEYKKPLKYKDKARIEIAYRHTDAAKLIFDYKIYSLPDNNIVATGYSIQVFLDKSFNLMWDLPPFIKEWRDTYLRDK